MHYVKSTPTVIGPKGHAPFDVERRTRLPVDKFRPIPRPTARWARLAREGSVILLDEAHKPADKDIEGYEPPPPKAKPADKSAPSQGE